VNKKFRINDFESQISDLILDRGYEYYIEDKIDEVDIKNDVVCATIVGSELYNVTIHLDKTHQFVTDTACTCPYDQGPYCKHVVAVLYHLESNLDFDHNDDLKSKLKSKSKDELVDILMDLTNEYPNLYYRLNHNNVNDEIEIMIDSYLDDYLDDGFISYNNLKRAIKGFENALRKLSIASVVDQFHIAFIIIKKYMEIYQEVDDSSGLLSSIKYETIEYLNQAAEEINNIEDIFDDIDKFIELIISESTYDIDFDLIKALIPLLRFEEIKDKMSELIKHLKSQKSHQSISKYYQNEITNLYYDFLHRTNEDEADAYMYTNIHQESMKIKAIEKAFLKEDYAYIINICIEAIQNDSRDMKWYDCIVKAYKAKNQLEKAIPYMRKLIILGNLFYYQEYKAYHHKEKWQEEVGELLKQLSTENYAYRTIEFIMIEEKRHDLLIEYVNKYKHKVFSFYQLLNEQYFDETKLIMEQEINHEIQTGSSKKHYNYRMKYIDIYLKAYGKNETEELIDSLKYSFRNRKALNEVLDAYLVKLT
jgi:uncharacterized Zn finger protein